MVVAEELNVGCLAYCIYSREREGIIDLKGYILRRIVQQVRRHSPGGYGICMYNIHGYLLGGWLVCRRD